MGVARRWLVVWSQVVGVCWSQADYASHSTTTTADFQGCGGSACADCSPTCTHAAAGSRCTKQSDAWWMCWPPGGVSAYGTYNLQLYGWAIESRFFSDATDGNRWLAFYNACGALGFAPGGIGLCGDWGATRDRLVHCGASGAVDAAVVDGLCSSLCRSLVPAATDADEPFLYRNAACADTPTFPNATKTLVDAVCGGCDEEGSSSGRAPTRGFGAGAAVGVAAGAAAVAAVPAYFVLSPKFVAATATPAPPAAAAATGMV